MIQISYPSHKFRLKEEGNTKFIFDELRRLWLKLTPEEWVRQNFIQYLVQIKQYPSSLIAQEKKIKLGELTKRFDILIYDRQHSPWMMVECKSTQVTLKSEVLEQVLHYNISIPVSYLVITNGNSCFAYLRKDNILEMLSDLPLLL